MLRNTFFWKFIIFSLLNACINSVQINFEYICIVYEINEGASAYMKIVKWNQSACINEFVLANASSVLNSNSCIKNDTEILIVSKRVK
jgi:hypothetical protein